MNVILRGVNGDEVLVVVQAVDALWEERYYPNPQNRDVGERYRTHIFLRGGKSLCIDDTLDNVALKLFVSPTYQSEKKLGG